MEQRASLRLSEAGLAEVKEIDLLLVGGPTQRHGLSPNEDIT